MVINTHMTRRESLLAVAAPLTASGDLERYVSSLTSARTTQPWLKEAIRDIGQLRKVVRGLPAELKFGNTAAEEAAEEMRLVLSRFDRHTYPAEASNNLRPNLRRLKQAITKRWGTVPLIDMLKETVLRTGCLEQVTTLAGREAINREELAERLILLVYAYGTNTGVRAVAAGDHGHTEEDLRYVRRRYLSVEAARLIAAQIANATFAARQTWLWGEGSTAVASDSTHFSALDQNIFTECHSR